MIVSKNNQGDRVFLKWKVTCNRKFGNLYRHNVLQDQNTLSAGRIYVYDFSLNTCLCCLRKTLTLTSNSNMCSWQRSNLHDLKVFLSKKASYFKNISCQWESNKNKSSDLIFGLISKVLWHIFRDFSRKSNPKGNLVCSSFCQRNCLTDSL